MDFKIAGTRSGVTAIQLDIKPAGIPLDIICECLEPAFKARLQILDHMEREIKAPRTQDERNSPRIGRILHGYGALLCRCLICSRGTFDWSCFLCFRLKFTIHIAVTLKYSNEALRRLIGPLGALKRKIEEETGLILPWEHFIYFNENFEVPLMND